MDYVSLEKECMDALDIFFMETDKSPATREKYRTDVLSYLRWLEGYNYREPEENMESDGAAASEDTGKRQGIAEICTYATALAWKNTMSKSGLMPSTVNSRIAAVNALLMTIHCDRKKVKTLRVQKSAFRNTAKELTVDEYRRLIDTAYKKGREKTGLIIETICSTGIRVSELRYITVEAAFAGSVQMALKGKIRTILLPERLCVKLLAYSKRKNIPGGGNISIKNRAACGQAAHMGGDEETCERRRYRRGEGISAQPPSSVCPELL